MKHHGCGKRPDALQEPPICWRCFRILDLEARGVLDERCVAGEGERSLHARRQHNEKAAFRAKDDLDLAGGEVRLLVRAEKSLLPDFRQCIGWKRLVCGSRDQIRIVRLVMQGHPLRIRDWPGTHAAPVDFMFADPQTTNVFEEEKRNRAFEPFLKVLLDFSLAMNVDDWYVNLGMAG